MLAGHEAFAKISRHLNGELSDEQFADPPFERLSRALSVGEASKLELAILVRHVLRHESLARAHDVYLDTDRFDFETLRRVGIEATQHKNGVSMRAAPWSPSWLDGSQDVPVDESAMRTAQIRFHDETPGDLFLSEFGLTGYRSAGQRLAVRSALSMPPGESLVIDLPTGEGKSLVFRVIDRVGFASEQPNAPAGITLVIVPTVTLGFDHESSCGGGPSNPLAYIGGEEARNRAIRERIMSGEQRLLFASPEAVVGPLRRVLTLAVTRGQLRAVCIDEAHLVDGWGSGFRTQFQLFAGVYHSWREKIPLEKCFRLIFLSATFSASARDALRDLFSPGQELPLISSASVRPEPEFWIADTSDRKTQDARVLEALFHLPRPAILYVTEVARAQHYHALLRAAGMAGARMLHGQTRSSEREKILAMWSAGDLDVVVGTSAFGLGVDYAHVRSIVHACHPARLDRFYQEVGRSGRDGCASVSLWVPAHEDRAIAVKPSQKLISVERGLQRWKAMFDHPSKTDLGDMTFAIRLDIAPSNALEDIDMIGRRSIDWNSRILSIMARSGLVRLAGGYEPPDDEEFLPYQAVKILNDRHLDAEVWKETVGFRREEILKADRESFQILERLMTGENCPGELLENLYRGIAHRCSGCSICRMDLTKRRGDAMVKEGPVRWRIGPTKPSGQWYQWSRSGRLVVEYPENLPSQTIRKRDLKSFVGRLDDRGMRVVVLIGSVPEWLSEAFTGVLSTRPWVLVKENSWQRPLWPSGNSVIICGSDLHLGPDELNRISKGQELILIAENAVDKHRPDRLLADVISVPCHPLSRFVQMVLS
jgi:ATP-dependent DNA helicase RecQ